MLISGLGGKEGVLNGSMGDGAEELDVDVEVRVRDEESNELGAFCLSR